MTYSLEEHIWAVEGLMLGAKQTVGKSLRVPTPEERILRAKLIYEEALETIEALGVDFVLGKFIDAGEENYNPEKVLALAKNQTYEKSDRFPGKRTINLLESTDVESREFAVFFAKNNINKFSIL
jgi:hypothetical protein